MERQKGEQFVLRIKREILLDNMQGYLIVTKTALMLKFMTTEVLLTGF